MNWCAALGTVLANEEVSTDGRSERGGHKVEQRRMRQWMLRITAVRPPPARPPPAAWAG
eukprot:SAG11_NODE_34690_length_270_cov_1.204678_1_plen_59_part_00